MNGLGDNHMTFQIEKNIPLPPKARPPGRSGSMYPFLQLEIGDSFFVPNRENGKTPVVHFSKNKNAKNSGLKFTARKSDGGVRVWRIL
jgi:hypothetical protein